MFRLFVTSSLLGIVITYTSFVFMENLCEDSFMLFFFFFFFGSLKKMSKENYLWLTKDLIKSITYFLEIVFC